MSNHGQLSITTTADFWLFTADCTLPDMEFFYDLNLRCTFFNHEGSFTEWHSFSRSVCTVFFLVAEN